MKQKIVYIGLDVDDTQYHGSALNKETVVPELGVPVRLTRGFGTSAANRDRRSPAG